LKGKKKKLQKKGSKRTTSEGCIGGRSPKEVARRNKPSAWGEVFWKKKKIDGTEKPESKRVRSKRTRGKTKKA